MKTLKNHFFTITIACLGLVAAISGFAINDEPTISRTLPVTSNQDLSAYTSGGGINVVGHDEVTAVVNVFVRKNGSILKSTDKLVKKLADGFDLKIETSDDKIYAHARKISNDKKWTKVSVEFEIKVPLQTKSAVETSGGALKLSNLEGVQKLLTSGGSINVEKVTGTTICRTSGGSIRVVEVQGDLDVSTSGGSIKMQDITGRIKANTSGGRISILQVNSSSTRATTSGGSINIQGNINNLTAKTSGGSIKADVTGLSERLNLNTSGGSIQAIIPRDLAMNLDLKGDKVEMELSNFEGKSKYSYVEGKTNGGGIPVTMKTSGGSVKVSYQE